MTLTAQMCVCQQLEARLSAILNFYYPSVLLFLEILLYPSFALPYISTNIDISLSMSRRTSTVPSGDSSSGVPPSGDGGAFEPI